MKISFVTLFPDLVKFYFSESILARAIEKRYIDIAFINPRLYSTNIYKKVDDYKIGGGAGLLMQAQPLFDALNELQIQDKDIHFVFLTPSAKTFNQIDAKRLSKKKHICFVCGRYEGIDERVIENFANEVFSIGDFVLTGGELPALVMCDAIARNITGVLGNPQSLEEESFEENLLEAPSFSKPYEFIAKNKKNMHLQSF